jgi:Xaa-Pro aminopeptidase
MASRKLDAIVCGLPHHVYYLTSHWTTWIQYSAALLFADGRMWLTTANEPAKNVAADQVIAYEANWMSTLRQEQPAVVAEQVAQALHGLSRIGMDASPVSSQLAMRYDGEVEAIDPALWQLRRQKDPDELELMKKAIRCCQAMYARARQLIEPGIPELEVFTELNKTAVFSAAEPLSTLLGNDYASGLPGGPARNDRRAQAGEIYILDLGPVYRGYFSDNARSFAVDRHPTDAQLNAWQSITGALHVVEQLARPGVRCRDIFAAVDEHFRRTRNTNMPHHLGHGVGLQPHEFPHLNPKWDDTLLEGEVFAAEPGQYAPNLNAGIRLENQYLVTKTGVENLLDFPLDLVG